MSVVSTMSLLASIWQNFSGDTTDGLHLETVFDRIPRLIYPAQVPCLVIFPGRATYNYDQYGEKIVSETRPYRCVLCASVATLGNQETGEVLVEPFISKVRDYFAARPALEDDNAALPRTVVAMARITGDGGYFIFEYPSSHESGTDFFHATDFQFEIQELASISYKD